MKGHYIMNIKYLKFLPVLDTVLILGLKKNKNKDIQGKGRGKVTNDIVLRLTL